MVKVKYGRDVSTANTFKMVANHELLSNINTGVGYIIKLKL